MNHLGQITSPQKCSLRDNGLTKDLETPLSLDTYKTSSKIVTDTTQIVSQKLRLEMNEEVKTDTNAISALRIDLVEIQGAGSKKKNFTLDGTKEGNKCYV